MIYPKIIEITSLINEIGCRTYLLTGGDIRQDWALTAGEEIYCQITIWDNGDEPGDVVNSYSGTVWPSAYPALFEIGPRTTHGQTTRLTDLGKQLIMAARKPLPSTNG
jgi:hypothetical protein